MRKLTGFAVLPLASALALASACASEEDARSGSPGIVYRIPVTGVIEHGIAPFIERSVREAQAQRAIAAILDMDTPGGRVDAAERIVDALADATIPVYTYVNRRAFSAGALIAMATDHIYMRPGAVMGAATPVSGEGEKAPEKIVSAMRSEMRSLAERRGLDPRIAEAMVDEDIEIAGLTAKGKLLTLTTSEAVRVGYASQVEDWPALLEALRVAGTITPGTETRTAEINWAESVVRFLTHPLVAPLLLSLGFLGLIFELKAPGFGLAGGAGLTALALFFGAHYIVGLAGWEELILLGIGLVLLGIEIFVVPGFGIFGIAGIIAVLVSVYLSLLGKLVTTVDLSEAAVQLSAVIIIVLVAGWVIIRKLPRSRRLTKSGIFLREATGRETGYVSATERGDLLGATGVALTDLRPAGTAQFGEERVDVVSEGDFITAGTAVKIVRSEGYRHVVKPAG